MGKKISEDEIKWILSVESAEAQQNIHALTKENKELTKANKDRRTELIKLEKQGKKDSQEYKNLTAVIDSNNTKIKANIAQINKLENSMGLSSLTMSQLKKKAKDLQLQLDHTSKSANPKEYAALDNELKQVRGRMDELKGSSTKIHGEFGKLASMAKLAGAAAIAAFGYKLLSKMKDLASDSIEMAESADGIVRAFDKLNRPDILDDLRKATNYTVNDLTLMKAAVKANDLNVPFKDLANYLALAEMQAEKTGGSIDELMDTIITGMAKQSSRSLINVGISKTEIEKTKKETGDFMSAVNLIIEKRLKEQGDDYVSAGDVAERELAKIQNEQLKLGESLLPLKQKFQAFWTSVQVGMMKALKGLTDSTNVSGKSFDEAAEKVVNLQSSLPTLASRYDELKGKVNLTNEEHKELDTILGRISSIVPSAITSWDKYGNAISINTGKVREYLLAEKSRLKFMNREAIEDTKKQIKNAQQVYNVQKQLIKDGGKDVVTAAGTTYFKAFSSEQMQEELLQLKEYGDNLRGAQEELKRLSGMDVDKWLTDQVTETKAANAARINFTKMNKAQLSAWLNNEKNAADKYKKIAQQIYDDKFKTSGGKPDKSDPNVVALKNIETTHQTELNKILLNGQEKQQIEETINASILESEKKYQEDRIKMLEGFALKEKNASKKSEYQNQVVESKTKLLEIEVNQEKAKVEAIKKVRTNALQDESNNTKIQTAVFSKNLEEKIITQEQYDLLLQSGQVASTANRLKIEQQFQTDVNALELKNGNLKADAVKEANQAVLDADAAAATARINQQKTLDDLTKDFKSQFKLTTVDEDLQLQMEVLDAAYQARKEMAIKEHLDTAELDASYARAKEQLVQDSESKIIQIRSQYGLINQQEQYNLDLEALNKNLDAKLLTQKEYEKAVKNLKRESYKKQVDYYTNLFSSAITSLQQSEMDNIDAKYDVEIEAAKGNSEEIERLENEKAQKKLDVQKKYADLDFAIKASTIIADTAVAIMAAMKLGPIAGPIAAALMGVTGLAQLASANAERQKIKNMTVNTSSSSASSTSGTMTATGLELGGSIDVTREQDGKRFNNALYDPNRRGFVDRPTVIVGEGPVGRSKEWIASNDAVSNPTVAPFISILDKHQQAGTIRTLDLGQAIRANAAGFASGGYISKPIFSESGKTIKSPDQSDELITTIKKFNEVITRIADEGLVADVSLTDLERKQNLRNKARKIGTKK